MALLLDGVRCTDFCHCSGRPICNSHIDPSTSALSLFLTRCADHSVPYHDAFQPRRAVLMCSSRAARKQAAPSSRRASAAPDFPRRVGTIISPVSPLTGQRGWTISRLWSSRLAMWEGHCGKRGTRVRGERASKLDVCQIPCPVQQRGRTREPTIDPRRRGGISTDHNGSSRAPQAPVSPPAECHLDSGSRRRWSMSIGLSNVD